jgi:hypothetical protein
VADTFQSRIPTLSEAELRQYIEHPLEYRSEAVEAALAELERRGQAPPGGEVERIRTGLAQREEAASTRPGWLSALSPARLRLAALATLAVGLTSAAAIYLAAPPPSANPLGYEPGDTKKYLRDLELYGGKVNVLATQFTQWFQGLWHGRPLAYTVAWLTLLVAFILWFLASRQAAAKSREGFGPEGGGNP